MEGPPLGPGGEDITWPNQVAPRGRKASSTRKIKPQTSNIYRSNRCSKLIYLFVLSVLNVLRTVMETLKNAGARLYPSLMST